MDEYVWVDYDTKRDVYVDGTLCGTTNSIMTVQTGNHTFDLGKPVTYAPAKITVLVFGTSPLAPQQVKFVAEL
jgi:hypothetical protein